jgi:DNA polymerase-3 subunit alpha
VTDHPLLAVRDRLEAQTELEIAELPTRGDGDVVVVGGIIGTVARRFTKRGEPFAILRLEDLAGGVQVVVFPSIFERVADLVAPDRIVIVRGRVDLRGRELQVVAAEVRPLEESGEPEAAPADPILIEIPAPQCTDGMVARLKEVLAAHPGQLPIWLHLVANGAGKRFRLADGYRVDGSAGLLSELRVLLGPEAVRRTVDPESAPQR